MNRRQKKLTRNRLGNLPFKITLCGLCSLTRAEAQQQVAAPPVASLVQPIAQQEETNEFQVFAPPDVVSRSANQPFQWGQIDARPHVSYQLLYASGLESVSGLQENTLINELSPGVTFDLGKHWSLDYTPTLEFYSNRSFKNEFDNSVLLTGLTVYGDWTFGLSQSFISTDSPLVQTAAQTQQELYATAVTASDAFNDKMSLDLGIYQNLQFAEDLQNSRDWSTKDWLNYKPTNRLNFGVGVGVGYVNVDVGADQTYEQLSARANWRATDKLSFQVSAGLEDRQFIDSDIGSLISPTFSATIQYQPFEMTKISLNANRNVMPSYFFDQVTENTVLGASLNQHLVEKFFVDLGVGYDITKYDASVNTPGLSRKDDYFTFNARLSREIFKRGTIAIFYQYGSNSSTADGYTYFGSQVGVEFDYRF